VLLLFDLDGTLIDLEAAGATALAEQPDALAAWLSGVTGTAALPVRRPATL